MGVCGPRADWSTEEDTKLVEAVGRLGENWKAVCAHVQGRNPQSCYQRWVQHLCPDAKEKKAKAKAEAKAPIAMRSPLTPPPKGLSVLTSAPDLFLAHSLPVAGASHRAQSRPAIRTSVLAILAGHKRGGGTYLVSGCSPVMGQAPQILVDPAHTRPHSRLLHSEGGRRRANGGIAKT